MTTAVTLRGTPTYAAGRFGTALKGGAALGAPSVLPVPGALSASFSAVNMTIEGWLMLPAVPTATKAAFGHAGVFWVGLTTAGFLTSQYNINGTTSQVTLTGSTNLADGAWHHVALVVVNGVVSLYADGALVQTNGAVSSRSNGASGYDGLVLCGLGNLTAFDWPSTGSVDEVAVSSVAQYTGATYTVPTAAFAATRTNQIHLWHLDGDGVDAVDSATDATAPTISTFTATAGNTQNSLAWAGSDNVGITRWVLSSGGSTLYDGTATSYVHTGLTNGTAYSYSLLAYDAAANVSTASTASATPTLAASVTVAPNDPAIAYSPFTWDVTPARALCNTGGHFSILATASSIVANFDISNVPATAAQRSQIAYRVDGQAWTDLVPTATVAIAIPAATSAAAKHLVEIIVKATSETPDRWNSPYLTAVKFLGFTLNNGATVTKPNTRALNGLMLGDSITEGINTIGTSGDNTARSDTRLSWAYRVGAELGANVGVVGFGRQGLSVVGNGNVPVLGSTWKLIAAGLTRDLTTTPPDFVCVNIGTNDAAGSVAAATFQAAATAFLNDVIANTPAKTKIVWLYPFGLKYATSVHQAAIAATTNPRRIAFVDTTGWFSASDAFDGTHPAGYVNLATLAPRAAAAIRDALNRGRLYKKINGVLTPLRASRY